MPAPSNKAERICAMFDSYCKTVLRNASRNEKRTLANRKKHEVIGSEQIQCLFDANGREDIYPTAQLVIKVDKFSCVLLNDTLYLALLSLPENQRIVLLLEFWYHWTDEQIATYLGVTSRTVYNLRQRTFKAIRRFYEKRDDTS